MHDDDADQTCERIEAYIRPYVLALLRIIVAAYERERRGENIEKAMMWERPSVQLSDTQRKTFARMRPTSR